MTTLKRALDKPTRRLILGSMVLCGLLIIATPFLNSRSLTAFSKDQLYGLVYQREEGAIDREIKNDAELSRTYRDMLVRWKVIREELIQRGADDQTASKIVNTARDNVIRPDGTFPWPHWAVMARKGWIWNKPVWVLYVGFPKKVPCPLKANQLDISLTHSGQAWDGLFLLFDEKGNQISP